MNHPKSLTILVILFFIQTSCSAQAEEKADISNSSRSDIELLYFHYTRRCATCNAVESVSKQAIEELYGEKVKFQEYNLDEAAGKEKGDELEVSGQTLIILAGEEKIDITNEGFMNARRNPEKLKQIIKQKIDSYL